MALCTLMEPASYKDAEEPQQGYHQECFAGCFPL